MIVLVTTSSFAESDQTPLHNLEKLGLEVICNPFKRKLSETEVLDLILEYRPSFLIAGVEPITRHVLSHSKEFLKVISRSGIGLDSVDLQACTEYGIKVYNTPDAPTRPVAELTLGLILSLLRRIHESDRSIKESLWERPMGSLLYQKTIGIMGCGRIGSVLATLLKPFECTLLGYDPFVKEHSLVKLVSKDYVLSHSDIVTLHLPYTEENKHFISYNDLMRMKPGSFFINASRGGLLDGDALYQALVQNHLAGAAVDCYEQEPYTGNLKALPNILLTAHIGSYAKEARVLQEIQAVQNIILFLGDIK